MAAVVQVRGLSELRGALRKVADKDLQAMMKRTNLTAAQIVVEDALPNVPVGKTGNLLRSVRALGSQSSGRAVAGSAAADYAAPIHWGRKIGNVGSPPGNHPGPNPITGRSFLWDAAERQKIRVAEQYATDVDHVMDAIRRSITA